MDDKKYLKECFLEKIYHFDALAKWKDLEEGNTLELSIENDKDKLNKDKVLLNKDEVLLKLAGSSGIVGCLSKDDGKDILPFLQQGWEGLFSATISFKKDDIDSENKRIKVVIYINKSN